MPGTTVSCRANPYDKLLRDVPGFGKFYSLKDISDSRVERLPYCIRILLESAIRNCDEFEVKSSDVDKIIDWKNQTSFGQQTEIPFKPARVILQDFTGVPALVDLAGMRDAMKRLGGPPDKINPLVPVDLVIDHSVQVEEAGTSNSRNINERIEFERNEERFSFLKWGASSFSNMLIIPPGSGIIHQINLEYLARGVFKTNGVLYPDSVVGTDSHTTMIDGLGVVGWGVGGIEAEAVMLGQPISLVLPEVVGVRLTGQLPDGSTSTDLVLTITKLLRARGVVGKFVEYFGQGCMQLSIADRATIANMSPEYGATMGYFPLDQQSLNYLRQTGREARHVEMVEEYFKAQGLIRTYDGTQADPDYTGDVLTLDLSSVEPCIAGPKRPHDRVLLKDAHSDFKSCLTNTVGFKGFGLKPSRTDETCPLRYQNKDFELHHGSVVIAAITSCTNTSNPSVMLGAALLAKNAVDRGLKVAPYIKTSLSPGSSVVLKYLQASGLLPFLEKLGFYTTGLGCQTCIGNSGELDSEISACIRDRDLVAAAVLSGNRNFEGRVHPLTRANYLASPLLVVAYALAGSVAKDLQKDPIGKDGKGNDVYLNEIWPSKASIDTAVTDTVLPKLFTECYESITEGNKRWNELYQSGSELYPWISSSTYIHNPPFFSTMERELPTLTNITDAFCLLNFGDSVTTDHISPAGKISRDSPAGRYLNGRGVHEHEFNSYGSRRGNDEIMVRGTFANIRIVNKLASKTGPYTLHIPSGEEMAVFDVAQRYLAQEKAQLIILAGKEYGSGSSRDWAAKGPYLLGVKAVIAQTFERIHRSNLVGMGILPLEFTAGENADSLGLTGRERFSIDIISKAADKPSATLTVKVNNGKSFSVKCRIDTEVEVEYFRHGGILNYVLRKLLDDVVA